MKLDYGQKHVLTLINRDKDLEGWAKVSEQLYATLVKNIPAKLVTFEKLEKGGRARLTDEGQDVVNAMKWL